MGGADEKKSATSPGGEPASPMLTAEHAGWRIFAQVLQNQLVPYLFFGVVKG